MNNIKNQDNVTELYFDIKVTNKKTGKTFTQKNAGGWPIATIPNESFSFMLNTEKFDDSFIIIKILNNTAAVVFRSLYPEKPIEDFREFKDKYIKNIFEHYKISEKNI